MELNSQWHFQDFSNHQLSLSAISEGSCKGEGNLRKKKKTAHHLMSDVLSALTAAPNKHESEGQEDVIIGAGGYSQGKTHPENTKNKEEGKEERQGEREGRKVFSKDSLIFCYQT